MVTLKTSAVDDLKSQIDEMTSKPEDNAAGIVYVAVNKEGETIFEHASGKSGLGLEEDMTMDHTFWIASCTKMITGIACMQLVEQGKLALDDGDQVEKLAPELKEVQVFDGKQSHPKDRQITLRMLLSHTGILLALLADITLTSPQRASGTPFLTSAFRTTMGPKALMSSLVCTTTTSRSRW